MPAFKTCSSCDKQWVTRDDLLDDPEVILAGFQPAGSDTLEGYALFNHDTPECRSTIALEAEALLDMYDGPLHERVLMGSDACGGHCYRIEDLETCDAPCRNAMIREVLKKIRARQRRLAGD